LTQGESNLSAGELELLAVITCLSTNRGILNPEVEHTLYSDHMTLTFINSLKYQVNKLFRWSLIISQWKLIIKHKKGVDNRCTDARSRHHPDPDQVQEQEPLDEEIMEEIVATAQQQKQQTAQKETV